MLVLCRHFLVEIDDDGRAAMVPPADGKLIDVAVSRRHHGDEKVDEHQADKKKVADDDGVYQPILPNLCALTIGEREIDLV